LEIDCTKFYLNSFTFDIFIVQCQGGYFFPDSVDTKNIRYTLLE